MEITTRIPHEVFSMSANPLPLDGCRHRLTGVRGALTTAVLRLSPADRQLLSRLAVFPGLFTTAAVRELTGGPDPAPALARLSGAALVVRCGTRFRLLRVVREYFAAEPVAPTGPVSGADRERLDHLLNLSAVARFAGEHERAADRLTEALAICARFGDVRNAGTVLDALGDAALELGDYAGAFARYAQSRRLAMRLADPLWTAESLNRLGLVSWLRGDFGTARMLCAGAGAISKAQSGTRAKRAQSRALLGLGVVALHRGEHTSARALLSQSFAGADRASWRDGKAWSLGQLGLLSLHEGDTTAARRYLRASLRNHHSLNARWRIASQLEALAAVALASREPEHAVRLLGASAELRILTGARVPPVERAARQRTLAAARGAVPQVRFTQLWSAVTAEQVIREELDEHAQAARVVDPPLRVFAFGRAEVFLGSEPLLPADWTFAKPRELLYFLLTETDCTKHRIGRALWPWSTDAQVRNNFHTTLHHLRRALRQPGWVTYSNGRYRFDREAGCDFDVDRFRNALRDTELAPAKWLATAVEVYRGDFLDGEPGEHWITERRAALREDYERAVKTLEVLRRRP
ncbi:tetratricopeptide repeat protein [Amycolatopsis lurida]